MERRVYKNNTAPKIEAHGWKCSEKEAVIGAPYGKGRSRRGCHKADVGTNAMKGESVFKAQPYNAGRTHEMRLKYHQNVQGVRAVPEKQWGLLEEPIVRMRMSDVCQQPATWNKQAASGFSRHKSISEKGGRNGTAAGEAFPAESKSSSSASKYQMPFPAW